MRWKADLPKMPRLPKVPLESGDRAAGALGPPPAPSAFREQNPPESQPAEYRAPSMLVEHRGLAVLFAAAAVAFALYCLKSPPPRVALDRPGATTPGVTPKGVTPPGVAVQGGAMQGARGSAARAAAAPGAAPQTPAAAPEQAPIYVEAVPDRDR
jgi:hypothetical protein